MGQEGGEESREKDRQQKKAVVTRRKLVFMSAGEQGVEAVSHKLNTDLSPSATTSRVS